MIRDEIGESDGERDKILLQLEQECLNPKNEKINDTVLIGLFIHFCFEKGRGTLKQQISAVNPVLDELRLKKQERIKVFYETESQIAQICAEIACNDR
ncbi:hypothetical protein POTOM_003829 [Populus tomentosa]|uniref:Uncharacterized protein n=1 Tax=Populus tomentosa TaxID=118781 RepID=A0A8X8AG76_POPTO|nr:hypothetical protein POTOM_003829 [Populus tomentosa]